MSDVRAVYKFPFVIDDHIEIEMQQGAEFLAVQAQREQACIWALVDPDAPKTTYRFRLVGTGHPLEVEPRLKYLGTFQLADGGLVFHLFGYA
jgi:hypothetical protein